MTTDAREQAVVEEEREEWDTIVIGSGIGGLAVASLLSQCQTNHRVLVLEQNPYHAGGCCQAFEREGFRFGVGLHVVGDMSSKSDSRKIFDALAPESDPIGWSKLPDPFDTLIIGKEEFRRYDTVAHRQEEALIEQFPDEREGIHKFFQLMKKAKKSAMRSFVLKGLPRMLISFLVHTGLYRWMDKGFHKYANMTVAEVTESVTENADLRTVLGYMSEDCGIPPDRAPFVLHALIYLGFLNGAYYPTNGPGDIPDKISKAIQACGGEVRISSHVTKILIDKGEAVGVELNDGSRIGAKQVISDAGFTNTFQKLIPKEQQPVCFMPAAAPPLQNGPTGTCLFVGLTGDFDDDFHLPHQAVWGIPESISDSQSLPESLERLGAVTEEDIGLYITVPCAKEQAWKSTYPGKTTIEVMTVMPLKPFVDLLDEHGEMREDKKEDYEQFKRTFGQLVWNRGRKILIAAGASTNLPENLEDADFCELGTPLTFEHFLGRSSWMGLDHGVERFCPHQWFLKLRPECKVKGLFLTGQDSCMGGIEGALLGGCICAAKIIGEKNPFYLSQRVNRNRAK